MHLKDNNIPLCTANMEEEGLGTLITSMASGGHKGEASAFK